MDPFADFGNQLAAVWRLVVHTWWLWLPVLLFFAFRFHWKNYLATRYFKNLKWVVLEIRIPRDIAKGPEAMEQVYAALQTMYFGFDPIEVWWEGLQHDYLIFELVSMDGEVRFYVRCPIFFRNVVESAIYAQYPEAEIVETEDYMKQLPDVVPNEQWNLWGGEFELMKEDAYPIRTYMEYATMKTPGAEPEEIIDPFANIIELMSKIKPGEHIGYHILMRPAQTPTPDAWKESGEALVAKLIGKKIAPKAPKGILASLNGLFGFLGELITALTGLGAAAEPKKEEKSDATLMQHLSPGVKNIVEAIERNIMKPAFEVVIRFCYVSRRDTFHLSHWSSFIGAMKQFNTQTMNGFKPNSKALATKANWWLPEPWKSRKKLKKARIFYSYYQNRAPLFDQPLLKSKMITLNIEELATIFHFPGRYAKAPMMPRIESKRSEPPAALPVG